MQKQSAITLVALVITVVVLLILAGVTINLTIGENGIFKIAKQAAQNYTNVQNKELADLNDFNNALANIIENKTEEIIDKTAPTIELIQVDTTNREYSKKINVTVTDDASQVKVKKYAPGYRDASYFSNAGNNLENSFVAKTSEGEGKPEFIYTVYAKDKAGNESVKSIAVQNLLIDSIITIKNGLGLIGEGSSIDKTTGVMTMPKGSEQFGPYWHLPEGSYEVTYTGSNLSTIDSDYRTYYNGMYGGIALTRTIQSISSQKVVYIVEIPSGVSNAEFAYKNVSDNVVYIDNIRIKQL